MGRKVNPKAIRIGINRTWDSVWYTDKSKYPKLLQEDLMIREEVRKSMKDAGLDSVKINKFLNKTEVIAYVGRPGVAIGRNGKRINLLRNCKQCRRYRYGYEIWCKPSNGTIGIG